MGNTTGKNTRSPARRASHRGAAPTSESPPARFGAKRPILRFIAVFAVLMALFYGVFYTPPDQGPGLARVFRWHLSRYADASGFVLNLLGYDVSVTGTRVHAPQFSVEVVRGCDAMEAMAMFVAAIVAFPARIRSKLVGIAVGIPALAVLNLVRIVSLYIIGVHYRSIFETAHLGVWQTLFILATIVLWFAWAYRVTNPSKRNDQPAPA